MYWRIFVGTTSQAIPLVIQDSSSATGAGLGSLVFNTASLTAKYRREGQSSFTTITLVTATVGTWASGGFVASGGVAGSYEFGMPNAAIASGAKWVEFELYGAANMVPVKLFVGLDLVNYQDGAGQGMTSIAAIKTRVELALPNAAAGLQAGGLPVNGGNWYAATIAADDGFTVTGKHVTCVDANNTFFGVIQSDASGYIKISEGTGTGQLKTTAGKPWALATDGTTLTSGNSGTGARTVTITVNDGATALQSAIVRMTEGANGYTSTTNASGVATFNLSDATYTVAVSKTGYSYAGTTLVVDGTETATYSMTQVSISTPADPALTAAYIYTYDAQGAVAGSTVITFKLEDGDGTTARSFNNTPFTATSNAITGLMQLNLVKSTSYSARRGNGEWVDFTTSTASTYALPEVLGTP